MSIPTTFGDHLSRLLRPVTPLERGRLGLLLALVALTLGAWALTIVQAQSMEMPMGIVARDMAEPQAPVTASDDDMMNMEGMVTEEPAAAGMEEVASPGMASMAGGWTWAGFVTFFLAWAVMMAAMMFPAAAPMLLVFGTVSGQRRARGGAFVPTWVFAAGYLLVWTTVGAVVWILVQLGSELAGRLGDAERATWAPIALGTLLIVAGLYQLTPLKRVCLDHCRTPLGFVARHWRDGNLGALRMGITHGGYCLGCCWALFVVLVAAGVMSLAWMLLLTLVVFVEKVLPIGRRASQVVGIAFLVLGVAVATGVTTLPWAA